MQTIKSRSDIRLEYTWNLESIYATNNDWESDFRRLQQRVPALEALQGTLDQSGQSLWLVLQTHDELFELLERLFVYASMRKDEDTTNSHYQGLADRVGQLYVRLLTAASFIEPEILALPQDTIDRFFQEAPELSLYRQQLHDLNRKRGHVLSAEIEAVLAAAGEMAESPGSIFTMIDNADLKLPVIVNENGEAVELTKGNYQIFIRSNNRTVRKAAFEAMHGTFLKQRNTIAATFAAQVKTDIFYARQHRYHSPREMALANYNIPVSVYDMLVESVHESLPLLNRYLKLRKRILQLDDLHMYDLYVPIVEEASEDVSYDEARTIVAEALAPLGTEYVTTLRNGLARRWIDVYETPGKRGGAYSGGAYKTQPFILLNFQNNRESMFTLAHELGHSMHSFFTRSHQPYQYGEYTIFVAEVASTLNEALLTEYLLRTTTD
ncbi:MAG: M3 family oligoendopeptidase, partial [Ktedonobacteraceae bacterium]